MTSALIILDGFGIGRDDPKSNAIVAAKTPNIDRYKAEYSWTSIAASGRDVGLPADQMINYETGEPFTPHTTNPVPAIVIDPACPKHELRTGGRLSDLCPTLLKLMGMPQPKEMTGESLF